MHLLFLTDNFPPEVNAPASRTFEHCREWVKEGHKVTVITCAPNFPNGRVYEGYRNSAWQTELIDGIRVVRVWSFVAANEGFALRIVDYASYMVAAILASPFTRKVDLVVGTSPQLFTVCAAYAISRLKGVPFIFELRDLWPESIKAVGALTDGIAFRTLERIELFLYRKAAHIVALTGAFKQNLVTRGIASEKVKVITNGVDLDRFKPRQKNQRLIDRYGLNDKFVTGYIGTHGLAHGLETILDAAQFIQEQRDGDRHRFLFLGDGAMKGALASEAAERRLENVIFLNSVPKADVVDHWALLDASIIHLRRNKLFDTVLPSKMFEFMAMGVPILLGVGGEAAKILDREDVGLTFEPENGRSLSECVIRLSQSQKLRQRFQTNCLEGAKRYDRKVLAAHMLALLEVVATKTSGEAKSESKGIL